MKKTLSLVFIIFISCNSKKITTYQEMKSDNLISEYFSDSELKDLAKIVDFFEMEICNDSIKDLENCYKAFNKEIGEGFLKGSFYLGIDFKHQKKLYNRIDRIFFNEIWVKNKEIVGTEPLKYKESDYFELKVFGRFSSFLEKVGNANEFFKSFNESLNITGDISPSLTANIIRDKYAVNMTDIKNRLLLSIHFLTLNERNNNFKNK